MNNHWLNGQRLNLMDMISTMPGIVEGANVVARAGRRASIDDDDSMKYMSCNTYHNEECS